MNTTRTSHIEVTIDLENGDQNYYSTNKAYDNDIALLVEYVCHELGFEDSPDLCDVDSLSIDSEDNVILYVSNRNAREWEGSTEDLGPVNCEGNQEVADIRAAAQTTTQGVEKGARDLVGADDRR